MFARVRARRRERSMRYFLVFSLLVLGGIQAKAQNGIMHQSLGGTYDYGAESNMGSPRVHSSPSLKARSDGVDNSSRTRHGRSRVHSRPNKSAKE